MTTPKPIESLDSPRVILQKYADIDPDELGEDKFIGHHSLDKALKELEAYITDRMIEYQAQLLKDYEEDVAERERLARINELKLLDKATKKHVYVERDGYLKERIAQLQTKEEQTNE